MAKNHNRKNKQNGHSSVKIAVVTVVCACLVALITIGILILVNRKPESSDNSSTDTSSETKNTEKTEEKTSEEENDDEKWEEESLHEGENPNKLENLTGVISFAGVSEGSLAIRVMIDQTLGSSSTCEFTLTHDSGTTVSGTSNIEAGPSASFCSYSTPKANLKSGHYKINVKMTSPNKAGEIEGEVNI